VPDVTLAAVTLTYLFIYIKAAVPIPYTVITNVAEWSYAVEQKKAAS